MIFNVNFRASNWCVVMGMSNFIELKCLYVKMITSLMD